MMLSAASPIQSAPAGRPRLHSVTPIGIDSGSTSPNRFGADRYQGAEADRRTLQDRSRNPRQERNGARHTAAWGLALPAADSRPTCSRDIRDGRLRASSSIAMACARLTGVMPHRECSLWKLSSKELASLPSWSGLSAIAAHWPPSLLFRFRQTFLFCMFRSIAQVLTRRP